MRYLSAVLVCSLVTACGAKDDNREVTTSTYTTPATASDTSSSNLDEAMNIVADADQEGSGTALTITNPSREVTRVCAIDGTTAKVEITAHFTNAAESNGRFGTTSQQIDMTRDLTRVWSKEGSSINCDGSNTHVVINANADLTGLKTLVSFTRENSRSATHTSKAGVVTTRSVSSTSTGTRTVAWSTLSTNLDGTVVRSKSVASQASAKRVVTDKAGAKTEQSATIDTDAGKPLAIEVTYPSAVATDPSARLIKTGKIVATTAGAGRIESEFDNLKLSFTGTSCQPESGSVLNTIFAEGSETPAVIIKIEASAGSYTATDMTDASNPKEIEDFEYQLCDIRNFNN